MGTFREVLTQNVNNATLCTASVSSDMIRWRDVEVDDITTSGLRLYSDQEYELGEVLKIDLRVYSMITEFSIPIEGRIANEKRTADGFCYSVEYSKIEKHAKIQLDEIFKANIAAKTTPEFATGDGIYSFILNPRTRYAKV